MPVTISVCMSIASFICVHLHVLCVWEWVGMAALEFSWELHSMRRHVFYTALQWVPHWELAFDPAQWAGQCILHQTAGMGKGQYRMPSKDELVQRYNRMNTIPQVLLVALVRLRQDTSSWISLGYRDGWGNIGSDGGGWLIDHFKQSDTF